MTSHFLMILKYTWCCFRLSTFFLITMTFLANSADAARQNVYCEFRWADNAALNVKGGNKFAKRKVRRRELERLVSMGAVVARVAADHGQHCQLNHIENTLIDTQIDKLLYRLDPQGRIPNCADLNAIVECRGSRFIDDDVDRDSLTQNSTTFQNPTVEGYRLDWCLHWGQQCGKAAATAWCKRKMGKADGFAKQWKKDENIGTTYVMGDGKVCNQQFCDGFRWIECGFSLD